MATIQQLAKKIDLDYYETSAVTRHGLKTCFDNGVSYSEINLKIHCLQSHHNIYSWVVSGVYRHFQRYFSYIVVVSLIGGGHRNTRRKPPTCRKLITTLSHNVVSSTPCHERGSNLQL